MQEWNVQGGSRRSSSSEAPFSDGQSVRSVLCLSEEHGGLVRLDFALEDDVDLGENRPVAQWVRVFRSNEAEQAIAREAVETAEGLFVELFEGQELDENGEDVEAGEVRAVLKFLLALHLERKRVLRPLGKILDDGSQIYRHPKRDREYRVCPVEFGSEMFGKIEDQLDLVLI